MYLTVYLLLLAPAVLAAVGPRLTRQLAPAAAARMLAAISAVAALSTVWGLLVLAAGGLGRIAEVIAYTRPDPAALAAADPVPRTLGVLAAALLSCGLSRLARTVWRRRRETRALAGLRRLPAAGDLIVLADDQPDAYALPGRPRRIVVTSGMLRALPVDERTVLLAHEHAHLAHRHHHYATLGEMASALNPILRRLRGELGFALERWADEDAAHAVASRTLAARSLARAALAGTGRGPATALAYLRHQVTERVRALQGARPESRRSAALLAASLVTATALALADATSALGRFLEILHP
ncbi:M48 family metalloprotease [Streptomyces camelliae]|uniref:M48 family metalloprotease n=1 Tax=Streptomyces camelliae TaxID=3004093 RepID=A0ABY7NX98_9ACTN|nr:M48 family metalloprotease [Streptomyces sp. HUAS 2-6]WBO62859.1 M48 family metalloprotease [Streptomyces sp. HUAS 2-6]